MNTSIDFEEQKDYHIIKKINHSKNISDINNQKIHKINNTTSEKNGFKSKNKINNKSKNINDKCLSKTDEFCITNMNIIKDEINNNIKKDKKDEDKKDINKDNNKNNNNNNNGLKTNHSFWNYVLFKLSFEKKNNFFKINQNFRIKIISEEHLIRNHLNIYNLLRVSEKNLILKEI